MGPSLVDARPAATQGGGRTGAGRSCAFVASSCPMSPRTVGATDLGTASPGQDDAGRGKAFPMKIQRRFTTAGRDPYEGIRFEPRTSEIRNPDGTVVFRQEG